jgi:hypothetical protein
VFALSACNQSDSKTYDKCAKYDGKTEGAGFAAQCIVTKAKCEQAAQDWQQAVQQGDVTDATLRMAKKRSLWTVGSALLSD